MSPMSPRTLRPRQTLHPEAASWQARVVANGGTVGTSLSAVDRFCRAIDAAGIRDRFYRLSLFCGGTSGTAVGLNSALVPLYRGQSLGGTQYGETIDINANGTNLFVGANYNETGASGGLQGNANRYLDTGFPTDTVPEGNRHLSAYEIARSGSNFQRFAGSESTSGTNQQFLLGYGTSGAIPVFGFGSGSTPISGSSTSVGGHWLGVNGSVGGGIIYKNGTQDGSGSAAAATPGSASVFVFALNRASTSSAADGYAGRLGGYSIGLAMTAAQALAYYNAMQTFQAALNRSA